MSINIEQFQKTWTYRTTASVRGLRKAIRQIVEFERFHEAEKNRGTRVAYIGLIFIIFGFIIIGSTGSVADLPIASFLMPFGVSLAILGLGTMIWGSFHWVGHSIFDLSPRRYRYESLQNLLEIWQKDLKLSHKLKVSLDLQKQDDKSKFQKQEPYPNHKDGKIDVYRDEWLKAKGQFLDETKFFLQVTERYQVRSWTNANGRNRVRPVSKGFEIILKLNYLPQRYPNLPRLADRAHSAIKLPATVELKRLKIADERLKIKVKVPPIPETDSLNSLLFQSIVLTFMSAYQVLNLARVANRQRSRKY
ncbi:MAG: hypothetical protein SW833_07205 [Cyanobacteriota bacterium]|nr:hypothetical protein [Cyanobacteriota bacterium]